MRPRQLYRTVVEAVPVDPESRATLGKWRASMSIAGSLDDAIAFINDWLAKRGLQATSHGPMKLERKANGREGPGVVSVEDETWAGPGESA